MTLKDIWKMDCNSVSKLVYTVCWCAATSVGFVIGFFNELFSGNNAVKKEEL